MAKAIVATTGSVFIYDDTDFFLTDMTYTETFNEVDVTDTNTTGDGLEFLGGRAERAFTVDVITDVNSADITMNETKAIVCSFEDKTYEGSGSLLTKNVSAAINDAVKTSYSGKFSGDVVVTPAS